MLIFGKEKRKKKKRQWSGYVVPFLLDRFLGGVDATFEGCQKS
jgi:hypothetical protein